MDKVIKIIAIGFSVATIFLYFIGNTLWDSALNEWDIPLGIFPKSMEEYIIYGYLALIVSFHEILISLFIISVFATILFHFTHHLSPNNILIKNEKVEGNYPILEIIGNFFYIIAIIIFSIVIPFIVAYVSMKDTAKKFADNKLVELKTTLVTEEGKIESISIVTVNNNYCAYYDGNSTNIIPSSTIIKIITKGKKGKNEK